MTAPIGLKLKIALSLLIIAVIFQVSGLIAFLDINGIVNRDLYEYGLQFDTAWVNPYRIQFSMFVVSLVFSTLLVAISITVIMMFVRNRKTSLAIAEYFVPFLQIAMNFFAIINLTSVNNMINNDLYNYGLQFSLEWASPLLVYTILTVAFFALSSSSVIISVFLIHLSANEAKLMEPIRAPTKISQIRNAELGSFILITAGTSSILSAIIYSSAVLSFIGIGLLFWGILFAYIRKEENSKSIVVDRVLNQSVETMNQIINELDFRGKPIYLPPKYFRKSETVKVYISRMEEFKLPTLKQTKNQDSKIFNKKPSSMLLTPLGLELAKLIEKSLAANLELVDLHFLEINMSKVLVDNLEIARKFEMETDDSQITVRIEYFEDVLVENKKEPEKQEFGSALNSIVSSAIACVLAKTVRHPIQIVKQEKSNEDRKEIMKYQVIIEEG